MTLATYDRLIGTLDAFIDAFGGGMRMRGVMTAILILKHSLEDRGISISEVSRVSGAPIESIRRHFAANVKQGNLITRADPDDERVTRYLAADLDAEQARASRIARILYEIGPPATGPSPVPDSSIPFTETTCDALISVLQAFTRTLSGDLRIRAFKIAIVLLQGSLNKEGITASQISRVSGAPLETVRRTLKQYMDAGNLRVEEDPNDDRASRIFYRDPATSEAAISRIVADLAPVNWALFNTN